MGTTEGKVRLTAADEARNRPSWRPLFRFASLLVAASLVGGCAARTAPTPSPTTEEETDSPTPTDSPSPTIATEVLLKLDGSGNKTLQEFHATGVAVAVKFSYDCKPDNSFVVNFYGAGVSPELPDVITDEFGSQRSDTTAEDLNGHTGPFKVEVVTECKWSIEVQGAR